MGKMTWLRCFKKLLRVEEDIQAKAKPPRCPKCGAKLFMLISVCEVIETYYFYLKDGEELYDSKDSWERKRDYRCPECNEVLFTSGETAKRFLAGDFKDD